MPLFSGLFDVEIDRLGRFDPELNRRGLTDPELATTSTLPLSNGQSFPHAVTSRSATQYLSSSFLGSALCLLIQVAPPFAQYEWPTPKRQASVQQMAAPLRPSADAFAAIIPQDWPVPRSATRPTLENPPNLLGTTLAQPFAQLGWLIPAGRRAAPSADQPNLLSATLGSAPSPFTQVDWPLAPARGAVRLPDPPALLETLLAGAGATPPTSGDWPVPQQVPVARTLRTWTDAWAPVFSTAGQQPVASGDWPVPARRAPTGGQAAFGYFYIPAPFFGSADPNPSGRNVQASLQAWTNNLLESTLAPTASSPFTQTDWSVLPRAATGKSFDAPNLLNTALAPTGIAAPFTQADWPVPLSRTSSRTLLTWAETRKSFYVDDSPFGERLWLNPSPVLVRGPFTWTHTRIDAATPFVQSDWANPLRAVARETLTWSQTRTDAQPFASGDWPTPRRASAPTLTWTQTRSDAPSPFTQADWPTPGRPLREVPTWIVAALPDRLLAPFAQTGWANPLTKPLSASFLVLADGRKLFYVDAAPLVQRDWPLPLPGPPRRDGWIRSFPLTIIPVDFTPDPDRIAVVAASLRLAIVRDDVRVAVAPRDDRATTP